MHQALIAGYFPQIKKIVSAQANALLVFLRHKIYFISFLKKLKIQKVQKLIFFSPCRCSNCSLRRKQSFTEMFLLIFFLFLFFSNHHHH